MLTPAKQRWTRGPRGRLVVVGGHSRRVGKTSVMKLIERASPGMAWHALKISNHSHRTEAASPELMSLPDSELRQGAQRLAALLARGHNLLVESNRIVPWLPPDLVIFVIDPLNPDWKASSAACLERADALVFSQDGPCPAPLLAGRKLLPAFRLTSRNQPPLGFVEWLSERLPAAEVNSNEASFASTLADGSSGLRTNGCCSQAHQMGRCAGAGFDAFPIRSVGLV